MSATDCDLCAGPGGQLVADYGHLRIVLVDDADYPGFVRIIWSAHVREMSDLDENERMQLMRTVFAIERVQRETLAPHKMNLASLGNVTPHLHWHLIPRYADDAHFPGPIWGERQRTSPADAVADRRARLPALVAAIRALTPC